MFWKKKNIKKNEEIQDAIYNAQVKKYKNLDFIIATKKDKKATIKHFIESEENALQYRIQGLMYPEFHYQIDAIVKTKMTDFTSEEISNTYYHLLRLGNWFKPHKANFTEYQKALEKILPNLEDAVYHVCHLDRFDAYLVFGILNNMDKHKIALLTYDDFLEKRKFVLTYKSYTNYPGMRKKKARFIPFLEDDLLMKRVRKAILLFHSYEFKFAIGASIMLLLLDKEKASKELLIKLHNQSLPSHFVWILGDFYKDYQETPENKEILLDLYTNYPNEWIDEYQKQVY